MLTKVVEAKPLTLEDPEVQKAKRKFDAIPKRVCQLNFDELFARFQEEKLFSQIGDDANISREAVRLIYKKYFNHLFEAKTGKERRKIRRDRRQAHIVQTGWQDQPLLKQVGEKALAIGCTVESVLATTSNGARSSWLRINGKVCVVHTANTTWRPPGVTHRWYCHGAVSPRADFQIFFVSAEGFESRWFVIPTKVLGRRKSINLPTQKWLVYNNLRPKIDFWQYENAWQLLKGPE